MHKLILALTMLGIPVSGLATWSTKQAHHERERGGMRIDRLQSACRLLEAGGQHEVAAITSQVMVLLTEPFRIGTDHIIERTS
jgi:hypothetical protein